MTPNERAVAELICRCIRRLPAGSRLIPPFRVGSFRRQGNIIDTTPIGTRPLAHGRSQGVVLGGVGARMDFGSKRASMCKAGRLLAVPLLWCFAFALPVCAQDQTISQMLHTSWTGRDGAPQGIFAIAQTPDGILWIDSFAGLFTFDGAKFDTFRQKLGSTALSGGTLGYMFVSNEGIVGTGLPKAAVLL